MPLATIELSQLTDHGDVVFFDYCDRFQRTRRGLVICHGDQLYAFQNRCPHWGTPLDADGQGVYDGAELVCKTHGARFEVHSGECVSGPCFGDSLSSLDVEVDGEQVHILRCGLSM